jgi:ribonuclease HI
MTNKHGDRLRRVYRSCISAEKKALLSLLFASGVASFRSPTATVAGCLWAMTPKTCTAHFLASGFRQRPPTLLRRFSALRLYQQSSNDSCDLLQHSPRPWPQTTGQSRSFFSSLVQTTTFIDETIDSNDFGSLDRAPRRNLIDPSLSTSLSALTILKMKRPGLVAACEAWGLDQHGTVAILRQRLLLELYGVAASGEVEDPMKKPTCYIMRVHGISDKKRNTDGTGIGMALFGPVAGVDEPSIHGERMIINPEFISGQRKFLEGYRPLLDAQYEAILAGLRRAQRLKIRHLLVQVDEGEVVVAQYHGLYPPIKPHLQIYAEFIRQYSQENFDSCAFEASTNPKDSQAKKLASTALGERRPLTWTASPPVLAERGEFSPVMELSNVRSREDGALSHETSPTAKTSPPVTTAAHRPAEKVKAAQQRDESATMNLNQWYLLRTDGGARGNPTGTAGVGMVLYAADRDEKSLHASDVKVDSCAVSEQKEICCAWHYLGDRISNNAAEYAALILGLRLARSMSIKYLQVQCDSELVVKQLQGVYRVKSPDLKLLFEAANIDLAHFSKVEVTHIRRSDNSRADWLANHAMDNHSSYGLPSTIDSELPIRTR